jgi:hypothetical protein
VVSGCEDPAGFSFPAALSGSSHPFLAIGLQRRSYDERLVRMDLRLTLSRRRHFRRALISTAAPLSIISLTRLTREIARRSFRRIYDPCSSTGSTILYDLSRFSPVGVPFARTIIDIQAIVV